VVYEYINLVFFKLERVSVLKYISS
jgi:hypothetical protein